MEPDHSQDFRTIKSIGEPIDRKFVIGADCREHGHHHDEYDSVLFLAKDKALPATLEFYKQKCIEIGAAPQQIKGIELLIERVNKWQARFSHFVKVPDVDLPVGADIIAPNKTE